MFRQNLNQGILQRREDPPGDPAGGGGGSGAWYESLEGVKDNTAIVESLKAFKTPVEAFQSMSRGFGDQWREAIVSHIPEADRPKALEFVQRYATPKALFDGFRATQAKISSGEFNRAPGEKASPEEVAAYRATHGIPEKPEGYLEKLPNGLVLGEDDKEVFGSFASAMHALHAPPALVHAALGWYNKLQDQTLQGRQAADTEDRTATEDALRVEFGADYRPNMRVLKTFLEGLPGGIGEILRGARGEDGRALFNNPDVVRGLVSLAREMVPGGTLMGGSGGGGAVDIDAEIAQIEKYMREKPREYAKDLKAKQRLESLYDVRAKQAARKGGQKAA